MGLSQELSLLLAGFNGIAYFLSSLPPIWILDRLGRRKLMLFAVIGMCCCMSILAGTVSNGNKASGIVASVMLFLFNFFFAVGMLAIPWLLPSEYAPLAIRTPVAALASASNWIFTFRKCSATGIYRLKERLANTMSLLCTVVVLITPVSIGSIGWKTYVYFGVFNACFIPAIYFFCKFHGC